MQADQICLLMSPCGAAGFDFAASGRTRGPRMLARSTSKHTKSLTSGARTHTHTHAHARTRSDALTVTHSQVMDLQGLVRNGKINGKPVTDALTDITAACQAGN